MRMEVVTHTRMISLGILAKNHFVEGVLDLDEDGKSFDTLQTVKPDTLERVKALPIEGAFNERIKKGTVEAFEEMKVGDKFLCLDAWVTDYKGKEAKLYWKVQELCNEGYELSEASRLASDFLEQSETKEK